MNVSQFKLLNTSAQLNITKDYHHALELLNHGEEDHVMPQHPTSNVSNKEDLMDATVIQLTDCEIFNFYLILTYFQIYLVHVKK